MAAKQLPERREAWILFMPLLAGLFVPWAGWALTGRLAAWALAGASFAVALAYLLCLRWLGDREAEMRRRLGRRYQPPSPGLAGAICVGLAASLIAPGLSVQPLAATVGYPRLSGAIRAYVPADLARTGADVALSPQALPIGASLQLFADGTARMTVPRFGRPTVYAFPWHAAGRFVCLAEWCFGLDPVTGRLTVPGKGGVSLGRVMSVGASHGPPGEREGTPWELGHIFDDAALFGGSG